MNKIKENIAYYFKTDNHFADFIVTAEMDKLRWSNGKRAFYCKELDEKYKGNLSIIYYDNALWHEDVDAMRKQGFEVVEWERNFVDDITLGAASITVILGLIADELKNPLDDGE